MARLFFALWPDDEARRALNRHALRLAELLGGRAVPEEKIHLTLAFLGEVADRRRGAAEAVAGSVAARGFDVTFDETGAFRRTGVAWAGMSRCPAPLVALQAELERKLRAAEFDLEERAFRPHVTLARRIARALARQPIDPVGWRARAFSLTLSETATGRYTRLGEWMLGD